MVFLCLKTARKQWLHFEMSKKANKWKNGMPSILLLKATLPWRSTDAIIISARNIGPTPPHAAHASARIQLLSFNQIQPCLRNHIFSPKKKKEEQTCSFLLLLLAQRWQRDHGGYSKKFSSAKHFVKSNRPAVRQEFIFIKRRSSHVALRSFGRRSVVYR